jgi:hypothetical protein
MIQIRAPDAASRPFPSPDQLFSNRFASVYRRMEPSNSFVPGGRSEFEYFARQIAFLAIIVLVCANLFTYPFFFRATPHSLSPSVNSRDHLSIPSVNYTNFFPVRDNVVFTSAELTEAITSLHLPDWSRGHVNCSNARSEVTCAQVVKAWRAIRAWETALTTRGITSTSHIGVIHVFTKQGGIGNRVMQQTVASVIAMKTQRKVFPFDSGRHEYEYPPTIASATGCPLGKPHIELRGDGEFFRANFDPPNFANNHLHLRMVFLSSMIYLHHQLSAFCREAFGMHAHYFLLNYIMRIPARYRDGCKAITNKVPTTVRLFGIHLRFHFANAFFSRGVGQTLGVVLPFCKAQLAHKPTTFVLATDNQDMFNHFNAAIKVLPVPVQRATDGADRWALTDIVMLMLCEEWLLTWRSTYSALVALRLARRVWMVEKYSMTVFLTSHSQVLHIQTPLYIRMPDWKPFDLNSIASVCGQGQVEAMRFYYRWFVL